MTSQPGGRGIAGQPVRRLTIADVEACSVLAVDRDWEPAPEKWRLLFELGEVYGVDDPAGGLAGAVALTRYGPGLAAVGKMLVARRHGRQGLGGRLMAHVLDQAGDTVTCLIATEYGRPLYERLGFGAIDRSVRYIGPLAAGQPGPAGPGLREASPADLAVATALIAGLAAGAGRPVRLDVPGRQPALASWAAHRGLTVRRQSTYMVRGGQLPGAREHVFGPANMALC